MSFNSPYDNSKETGIQNTPAYGQDPHVQPTGRTSTLTVVGFVLSILLPLIGFIISIIAFKQAVETGDNRGLAKAGIIVGAVLMVLNIIVSFALLGSVNDAAVNAYK